MNEQRRFILKNFETIKLNNIEYVIVIFHSKTEYFELKKVAKDEDEANNFIQEYNNTHPSDAVSVIYESASGIYIASDRPYHSVKRHDVDRYFSNVISEQESKNLRMILVKLKSTGKFWSLGPDETSFIRNSNMPYWSIEIDRPMIDGRWMRGIHIGYTKSELRHVINWANERNYIVSSKLDWLRRDGSIIRTSTLQKEIP